MKFDRSIYARVAPGFLQATSIGRWFWGYGNVMASGECGLSGKKCSAEVIGPIGVVVLLREASYYHIIKRGL